MTDSGELARVRKEFVKYHDEYPTLSAAMCYQFDVQQTALKFSEHFGNLVVSYEIVAYQEDSPFHPGGVYQEKCWHHLYFSGNTGLPINFGVNPSGEIQEHNARCLGRVQASFGKAAELLFSGNYSVPTKLSQLTTAQRDSSNWTLWKLALHIMSISDKVETERFAQFTKACKLQCARHGDSLTDDDDDNETNGECELCECEQADCRGGWVNVLSDSAFAASIQLLDSMTAISGGKVSDPQESTDDSAEIPAEYRDGGKADGEPLTVKYIKQPETYGLLGPYLSKQKPKLETMTSGKSKVYRFDQIAALSTKKNADS